MFRYGVAQIAKSRIAVSFSISEADRNIILPAHSWPSFRDVGISGLNYHAVLQYNDMHYLSPYHKTHDYVGKL
jgi:hypothetical protein